MIHEPKGEKWQHFVKCQKSAWTDLEDCFKFLQARFQVVANCTRQWDREAIIMSIVTIPNILFVVFFIFVVSTTLRRVIVLGAIGPNVTLFILKYAWSEPRHGWQLFKDGKKIQNCCFHVYGHVCLSAQSFNFLALNLFCNFQTLWPFLCK
jgi:hypothetical protein